MLYILKKYWKYLCLICSIIIVFTLGIFFYQNDSNSINTENEKKLSEIKKEDKTEESKKTFFVDVKGAVNAPGVYEIEEGKRVIDAINLAGGLKSEADTINLNLSKKVKDENYIIVYTKTEIVEFKKNNLEPKEIVCASFECVCPDTKNDACISNESSLKQEESNNDNRKEENKKVSINNATKEELMTLSGIGESKADAIIKYRKENNGFKTIDELKNVSGIGESTFEKIKSNLTL